MKKLTFAEELRALLRGRFPYIYIVTWEEDRLLDHVIALNENIDDIGTARIIYSWTITDGLVRDPCGKSPEVICEPQRDKSLLSSHGDHALRMLESIEKVTEPALFVLKDFHVFFGDGAGQSTANAAVIRRLRDLSYTLRRKQVPQNVIFVSPVMRLAQDIEKSVTVLDFPLPTHKEIAVFLDRMIAANSKSGRLNFNITEEEKERLAKAAHGMTLQEAENAFAKAIVLDSSLTPDDVNIILDEKSQAVKRNGTLEYVRSDVSAHMVGGLDNLKAWLAKRESSWLESAKTYSLPAPKGILITGVPGCGKSLTAKAMSAMWRMPLLRLDMGRVFSGLLGSSEENFREAIKTASAVAPCILWIDEIEKGVSGYGSALGGGGTTARVFGSFLTWMQEKTDPVFVIATANDISSLPPEMMRKGRFDEIFFVDMPTAAERADIFKVHLEMRHKGNEVWKDIVLGPQLFQELAALTDGFVGAEIEQVVISGLFDAFSESRPLAVTDFERAVRHTVPLSVTQQERIAELRKWASVRAVSASRTAATLREPVRSLELRAAMRGGRAVDF